MLIFMEKLLERKSVNYDRKKFYSKGQDYAERALSSNTNSLALAEFFLKELAKLCQVFKHKDIFCSSLVTSLCLLWYRQQQKV